MAGKKRTPKKRKAPARKAAKRNPPPKAPAKRKRKSRAKPRPNRKRPRGAPAGLRRGTEAWRKWEAGQILGRWAIGQTKSAIVDELGLTEAEWRHRVSMVRDHAKPGDALLVWARYVASSGRRTAAAETILRQCEQGVYSDVFDDHGKKTGRRLVSPPNPNGAIGALRVLTQIDRDLVDMGLRLGLFKPWQQGNDAGEDRGAAAELSRHAQVLEEIVKHSGEGIDLGTLSESGMVVVAARLEAEFLAYKGRPKPPSLEAGG